MTTSVAPSLIDPVLIAWFILTALSVAYVAWDAFTNNPELKIMKWGWLLVTLYGGPLFAAAYVLSCQKPRNVSHEDFVRPLWKQAFGSSIHCMAGDATGVILAAALSLTLSLPMWQDVTIEYVFGFGFGLLIFQALFMRDMAGGSYWRALRMSFIPEWLSMNAVMAGMIPTMVTMMSRDMASMHATSLRFWGVMQLATIVGFAAAFPVNLWLVGVRLKHGMGTVRVLGEGGHAISAEAQPTAIPAIGHGSMQGMTALTEPKAGAGAVPATTAPQIVAMTFLTIVALGSGIVIATLFGRWTM